MRNSRFRRRDLKSAIIPWFLFTLTGINITCNRTSFCPSVAGLKVCTDEAILTTALPSPVPMSVAYPSPPVTKHKVYEKNFKPATQYLPLLAGKPCWNLTEKFCPSYLYISTVCPFIGYFCTFNSFPWEKSGIFSNWIMASVSALPHPLILYWIFLLLSALISALSSHVNANKVPPPGSETPQSNFL